MLLQSPPADPKALGMCTRMESGSREEWYPGKLFAPVTHTPARPVHAVLTHLHMQDLTAASWGAGSILLPWQLHVVLVYKATQHTAAPDSY